MQKLQNYIGGKLVDANAADTFELINPVDESVNGLSPISNAQDVDAAYVAAKEASKEWGATTPAQRQEALLKLADAVLERADELVAAQVRNTGQPAYLVKSEEIEAGADQIRFFAGAARQLNGLSAAEYMEGMTSYIRREPIGVVGQVAPWNYPFMMAVWKIAPALAAGNTIVLKPSETTPESTLLFAQIAGEFLPKGTLNVVLGDASTGDLVVSHKTPGLVSITGSVRAGREVAKSAAENLTRSHLELGGKAPCVVFGDADLDEAAAGIAEAGLFNAGQDCTAATRVLVEKSAAEDFIAKLTKAVSETQFGDPDSEDVLYGPLNNVRQLERLEKIFADMPGHAKVETGGKRADRKGFFFEPTVVTGLKQDDEMIQNEIFGPVITVQTFDNDDDALEKANGVEYGLASSVWTADVKRSQRFSRELDFGCVWINTHIPLVAEMPHGGFKNSGYGKDLSIYGLEEYTRIKHVMSAN
ncbi:gamma-aminobutyraldehyde dehydrogenase [Corynebacterium sp. H130]|uniref:gamma-aminobutyraldehyde dehydrogenase n=1 Tax=Corynebacterium sp. H130 TaxID=3133444 RepID=UPI0030B6AA8E